MNELGFIHGKLRETNINVFDFMSVFINDTCYFELDQRFMGWLPAEIVYKIHITFEPSLPFVGTS